ncbi:diacylglycerol/lipid kinase family protein [Actinopolymorpha alba]|uniref:diacylglycerol/lipid kinase family protein n=1 Tax=Actinopolymorpha alba TaxID=533267 RepID=UPI00039CB09F|nr:diacylglycerol kinase family protein [Actinopolymorpha alba]
MESLLVVTNPYADCSDEHLVQNAIDALRAEADVHVCRISMPGDLDGALHRRGGRTVVVAGGDRSLHTVVAALHRRNELDDALLAVLPIGASADFAHGAGIPVDPMAAAQVVLHGVERRFDLLVDCRGDVVVNSVRLGQCGRWHQVVGMLPLARHLGYPHGGGQEFGAPDGARASVLSKPLHVRIEADDTVVTDFDRPVLQVAVNNSPSHGPDKSRSTVPALSAPTFAPGADPADGLADVVVCFAVDPLSRARRVLRRPHPIARDDLLTVRARRISVAGQRFWLNSDGHASGTEQRCTWKVAPKRLRMIVPATTPSESLASAASAARD